MGKLYTDSLYEHESAKKPKEIEIKARNNVLTSFLIQSIKSFALFTIIGIFGKLVFYSSTEIEAYLEGYAWVVLIIFSAITSARFRSGNTLASGKMAGTGLNQMVNAEVNYMRKNRLNIGAYSLWLLIYGFILLILTTYFL